MLNVVVGADAALDIDLEYEWYSEKAGEDVADRYLAAVEKTKDVLCRQPDLGHLCRFRDRRLVKLRSRRVESPFGKHLIFYREENGVLTIFRVLHGMRDLPRRLLEPPGADG